MNERPGFEYGNYLFNLSRSRLSVDDVPLLVSVDEPAELIKSDKKWMFDGAAPPVITVMQDSFDRRMFGR